MLVGFKDRKQRLQFGRQDRIDRVGRVPNRSNDESLEEKQSAHEG